LCRQQYCGTATFIIILVSCPLYFTQSIVSHTRDDLPSYALLGRFLPRLRPSFGAASFFRMVDYRLERALRATVPISVATPVIRHTLPLEGRISAMTTILNDQTKCAQCGKLHFAVISCTDQPPVTFACLECGHIWEINQPVENESEEESPPAIT
jgi:hypothetical protein